MVFGCPPLCNASLYRFNRFQYTCILLRLQGMRAVIYKKLRSLPRGGGGGVQYAQITWYFFA